MLLHVCCRNCLVAGYRYNWQSFLVGGSSFSRQITCVFRMQLQPKIPVFDASPKMSLRSLGHSAGCSVDTDALSQQIQGWSLKLITCLRLVPRVQMMGFVSQWCSHDRFVSIGSPYLQGWFVQLPFCLNLLQPTGYVMHYQFNIQQLYALPTLYLCVLYLSENKQRLVPLTA